MNAGRATRLQVWPQAARSHAERPRPLSVATTHQARTRVEPEQHRSISSHEEVRNVLLSVGSHIRAQMERHSIACSCFAGL